MYRVCVCMGLSSTSSERIGSLRKKAAITPLHQKEAFEHESCPISDISQWNNGSFIVSYWTSSHMFPTFLQCSKRRTIPFEFSTLLRGSCGKNDPWLARCFRSLWLESVSQVENAAISNRHVPLVQYICSFQDETTTTQRVRKGFSFG